LRLHLAEPARKKSLRGEIILVLARSPLIVFS